MKPGASMYVCHSSSWQREFQNALEACGFEVRCQVIWAKNTLAWGFGRYKFRHEPIFYAHVAGQSDAWYGDKSQSTLWEENKPAANRLHPTMKPVELIERAEKQAIVRREVFISLKRFEIDGTYRHRAAAIRSRGRLDQNAAGRGIFARLRQADGQREGHGDDAACHDKQPPRTQVAHITIRIY